MISCHYDYYLVLYWLAKDESYFFVLKCFYGHIFLSSYVILNQNPRNSPIVVSSANWFIKGFIGKFITNSRNTILKLGIYQEGILHSSKFFDHNANCSNYSNKSFSYCEALNCEGENGYSFQRDYDFRMFKMILSIIFFFMLSLWNRNIRALNISLVVFLVTKWGIKWLLMQPWWALELICPFSWAFNCI